MALLVPEFKSQIAQLIAHTYPWSTPRSPSGLLCRARSPRRTRSPTLPRRDRLSRCDPRAALAVQCILQDHHGCRLVHDRASLLPLLALSAQHRLGRDGAQPLVAQSAPAPERTTAAISAANVRTLAAAGPSPPDSERGRPTTRSTASSSAAIAAEPGQVTGAATYGLDRGRDQPRGVGAGHADAHVTDVDADPHPAAHQRWVAARPTSCSTSTSAWSALLTSAPPPWATSSLPPPLPPRAPPPP